MGKRSAKTGNRACLGLDIGGSFVKYGAIDDDGSVLFSSRTPTVLDDGAPAFLDILRDVITEMVDHCYSRGFNPQAIGIGSPGTVNSRSAKVMGVSPNLPGWVDVELRTPFAGFGLPVAVDNDANCSAYAEFKFGAATGTQNAIVITLGTGIGSGIIIDGRLFHGSHFSGAELGHISINSHGPVCGCGNRGCLELYASAGAILQRASRLADFYPHSLLAKIDFSVRDDEPLAGVFRAAEEEDMTAIELLDTVTDDLAIGLAGIINAFDPEVVVLGGGMVDASAEFGEEVARKTKRLTFKSRAKKPRIVPAQLGNRAGFIGAAALAADLSSGGH